jgi:hypothetical protein
MFHGYHRNVSHIQQILICFFIVSSLFIKIAHAETELSYPDTLKPELHRLRNVSTAKLTSIIDPLHIQTSKDRVIFLSGLYIPDINIYSPNRHEKEIIDLINTHFINKKINIFQSTNNKVEKENFLGHRIAHIVRQDDNLWLQGMLIYEGYAQAYPTKDFPEMAKEMFHLETLARERGAGLWKNKKFKITNANESLDFVANNYVVAEGKVLRKSIKNNSLYLHFTPIKTPGLAIKITPEIRRAFSKLSINPMHLSSETIRVRGYISDSTYPIITLEHPILLEVLSLENEQDNLAPNRHPEEIRN